MASDGKYDPVDPLINGNVIDFEVLNELADNIAVLYNSMPNVGYRWRQNGSVQSGAGNNRLMVQSGSWLVPPFKGVKDVNINLYATAANNLYPIITGLRHQDGIAATCVVVGCTNTGFTVRITPLNTTKVNSGVFVTWVAVISQPS